MKREFRALPNAVSATEGNKVKGYFAKFHSLSQDLGGFFERLMPGCFAESIKDNGTILALADHDSSKVLGRVSANTLRVSEDSEGLAFDLDLPDTSYARDLKVLLSRGDVSECSFGFCVPDGGDDWSVQKDGSYLRTINKATLFEGSIVAMPAYLDTSASLRSMFPEGREEITGKLDEVRAKQKSEKRYRLVLGAVASQRWAILPEKLAIIEAFLNKRAEGIHATDEEIRAAMAMQHGETPTANGVAVIPVYGVIAQRMSMFDDISGGTSCEAISKSLKAALADETVGTIVLDIDSPGGTVTGVPELAAEIYAARGKKPIIGVANGMAASAAYWIASACGKIVVTPSGEVGSIGVYTSHQDVSAMLEKEGVKITFIQAGKYKTDGNPYEPLSADAKADIQDGVDKFYGMFTRGVAGGRGVSLEKVLSDFGQGRMLLAEDAVVVGMADEIATLDQVLAGLAVVAEPEVTALVEPVESEFQIAAEVVAQPAIIADSDMIKCMCSCPECVDGNCADCSDGDCDDPNCDDGMDDLDGVGELETLRLQCELRMRRSGINTNIL